MLPPVSPTGRGAAQRCVHLKPKEASMATATRADVYSRVTNKIIANLERGARPDDAPDANVEKEPRDFVIDMLRCIYCGYCEEVCPEEAIYLKNDFAIAGYQREELQFHKEKLLELGGVRADSIWKWKYQGAPPLDAPGADERKPQMHAGRHG